MTVPAHSVCSGRAAESLRGRLTVHGTAVTIGLLLVLGVVLAGQGLSGIV